MSRLVLALSVRAPWWWFILHGGKDVENRDWYTGHRGTVYLHASKWWHAGDIEDDLAFCDRTAGTPVASSSTDMLHLRTAGGCIVGQVDIVDCVRQSDSPWFFGKFGFLLRNPVAYELPIPCIGALGLFNPHSLGENAGIVLPEVQHG